MPPRPHKIGKIIACLSEYGSLLVVFLLMTGCAAVRNAPAPSPSQSLTSQWQTRYSSTLVVKVPTQEDVKGVFDWKGQIARQEANRLANAISNCCLFNAVIISDMPLHADELVIEALPSPPHSADPDQAWLMLYGGVVPIYELKT